MATHSCPGGCKRQVKYEHFACRNCWYRLPKPYRDEIWRWYQKDSSKHAAAMVAAKTWYDDNR
jgi:hypothetical protein